MSVMFRANYKLRILNDGELGKKFNKSEDDCCVFKLPGEKPEDTVGENLPLTVLKSVQRKWLYGPAYCLKAKRIIYPCVNFMCAVPCPCLLCYKLHPRCRVPASKLCKCLNCKTHQIDHDNFHLKVWHFGCKYCKLQENESGQTVHLLEFRQVPTKTHEHECDICLKTFAKRTNMERHKKTHVTGESSTKFTCEECGKQFARSDNYERHMKSVHGAPPHKCVDCGQTFKCFDSLLRHIDTRSKQDLNKCSKCEKIFCNYKKLWAHFTAEHPKLSCDDCGQRFTTKRSLKFHLDNKVSSQCDCGQKHCNKKSLNIHVKTTHE